MDADETARGRTTKLWFSLYLVGGTMVFLTLYGLHDAIWPGRGIFLEFFGGRTYRLANPRPPGDFSGVYTKEYVVWYYVPALSGIVMCIVGRWLQVTEPMAPHVLYSDMHDDSDDDG